MGCSNCDKTRVVFASFKLSNNIDFEEYDDFKLIKYHDSGTHTRFVLSPTGVLNDFALQNYGMRKPGNEFYVHIDDIEARPQKFVPVVELTSDLEELDSSYEFSGLAQSINTEIAKDETRPSVRHTEFAKLKGVGHLKVYNAYNRDELEGYVGEDEKIYIYSDQEFGE